eukprot:CAMPEP_0118932764 /NCGR_PEP_ID=MMETSP1169-20130426/10608_1 /TAXON_ID=36882 /ORGANISM="Pyramimonas obovata, Strain CCMP722" /LENGTH=245 /DNA_ID=CAMNT_0006875463 /DNA_START=159 /DNA_END=896 /DNA_ORIENTATION=-
MGAWMGQLSFSSIWSSSWDEKLKRILLMMCAAWTGIYGLIVAASAVPEYSNNKALGAVSALSGLSFLAVAILGILAAFSRKGEIMLVYLMFELLTCAGAFSLAYAVIGQEVAYCRQIALFRSAALKLAMPQGDRMVEETVWLGNQTWFESRDDNWATRIGIYGNNVGDPLTDHAANQCESFLLGAQVGTLSSIAAMIFVTLLKSVAGGYCSLSLFVNGVDQTPFTFHENQLAQPPAVPPPLDTRG